MSEKRSDFDEIEKASEKRSGHMRVVFMGTPGFAAQVLEGLLADGFEVLAAVSQPDKPKGRHRELLPTPVHEMASGYGIPVLQPASPRDAAFVGKIRLLSPDVIVTCAYGRILGEELLSVPPLGSVNIHASLLPRWRGAAPVQWAIISGDRMSGISTMLMDEGLDTGDICLSEAIPIDETDTTQTYFEKLLPLASELIKKTLRGLCDQTVIPRPQPEQGVTYAPILKKEMGLIDFRKSAREIYDLVRGMKPWPGTYAFAGERLLRIEEVTLARDPDAGLLDAFEKLEPGSTVDFGNRLYVSTGDGILEIDRIRPEGRKSMSGGEFLRGNHIDFFSQKRSRTDVFLL